MSLADELLADLEDDNDEADLEDLIKAENANAGENGAEEQVEQPLLERMDIDVNVASIRDLCKLRDSSRLSTVLKQIDHYVKNPRKSSDLLGSVEQDPEYQLIVESNNIAVDIDNEISLIHKFVKDKYQKRFPELDSLIMNEMDYIHAVKELGNDVEQAKNNEILQKILTQATIMIVSVTASTTQGTNLNEEELRQIREACDMAIELSEFKLKIFEYVESRMTFIAPNLSAIVGASVSLV